MKEYAQDIIDFVTSRTNGGWGGEIIVGKGLKNDLEIFLEFLKKVNKIEEASVSGNPYPSSVILVTLTLDWQPEYGDKIKETLDRLFIESMRFEQKFKKGK